MCESRREPGAEREPREPSGGAAIQNKERKHPAEDAQTAEQFKAQSVEDAF